MRALRLAGQQAALPHAEAVLLVHDGKAEIFKFDRIGQDRMGADNKTGAAVRNGRQCDAPLLGLHAADQQRDIDAERLQPVGQRYGMLPGQKSRSGPAGRSASRSGRQNQMAAAATSVLPLPTSPCKSRFIGTSPHRSLTISSVERRCAPVGGYGRLRQNGPRSSGCIGALVRLRRGCVKEKDADLQQIQLLKDEPAPCGGEVGGILRGMDGPHRLRFGGHPVAGQQCGGSGSVSSSA